MRTLDREDVGHGCQRAHAAGRPTGHHAPEQEPLGGLREVALVALLYVAYTASRLLAAKDRAPALHRAHQLLALETAMGLDREHALVRVFAAHPMLGLLSCYWYSAAHYLVTPLVLLWLFRQGHCEYLPARRALLIATILGLATYLLLPTAPPRMVAGYPDILSLHASAGWWGSDASAPKGMGGFTNELAAFPSLHAGWSLWVALATHRTSRRPTVRLAGWLHAGVTALVVVGTANHWVLDVVGGWLVVIVSWALATARWEGPRRPRRLGSGATAQETDQPSMSQTFRPSRLTHVPVAHPKDAPCNPA